MKKEVSVIVSLIATNPTKENCDTVFAVFQKELSLSDLFQEILNQNVFLSDYEGNIKEMVRSLIFSNRSRCCCGFNHVEEDVVDEIFYQEFAGIFSTQKLDEILGDTKQVA